MALNNNGVLRDNCQIVLIGYNMDFRENTILPTEKIFAYYLQ